MMMERTETCMYGWISGGKWGVRYGSQTYGWLVDAWMGRLLVDDIWVGGGGQGDGGERLLGAVWKLARLLVGEE